MERLPPSLAGKRYRDPTDRGVEEHIGERLEERSTTGNAGLVKAARSAIISP
jgi:hypothetical protein